LYRAWPELGVTYNARFDLALGSSDVLDLRAPRTDVSLFDLVSSIGRRLLKAYPRDRGPDAADAFLARIRRHVRPFMNRRCLTGWTVRWSVDWAHESRRLGLWTDVVRHAAVPLTRTLEPW
jgi:hypothetical protein